MTKEERASADATRQTFQKELADLMQQRQTAVQAHAMQLRALDDRIGVLREGIDGISGMFDRAEKAARKSKKK